MKQFFIKSLEFFKDDKNALSSSRLIGIPASILAIIWASLVMLHLHTPQEFEYKCFSAFLLFCGALFVGKGIEKIGK